MNPGSVIPGNPSLGAWTSFGLGTENQSLPGFVVLPDFRSMPFSGSQQWGSGFLPAAYQGTMLRWKGDPIQDLTPPKEVTSSMQQEELELLRTYNQEYLQRHFTNPDLQGRIDAYDLAYRIQTHVPRVLDFTNESPATTQSYRLGDPAPDSS